MIFAQRGCTPGSARRPTAWTLRSTGRMLLPALFVVVGLLAAGASPALAEEDNCAAAANPNVCENALPGDPPSNWQIDGVGNPEIEGYATSMSVDVGQTESFKIDTAASSYHIEILRLGYYGGDGARLVTTIQPSAKLPQKQPACLTYSSTGLIDCGNWGVSASWTVPSNAVSGVYIAELVLGGGKENSQIPFVVRNDASHSEILLQTSDATWEAYNAYGGNSLYTCTVDCPPGEPEAYKAAYAVSYNRPFDGSFTTDDGASYLFYAEYQMIYWLEENGYNVSYTSEDEVDHNGALLKNHKIFMSSGHDEYWSEGQRESVEAALSAGVNLAFFSGNEMFWKTRWGPSTEGTDTPYRTLITYKETHFNAPVDPEDPPTWTGSWRDPRFSPPADGGRPENALTGQFFLVNAGTADITVPSQYSKLRLWKNTAVSTLRSGQSLTLAPGSGTLGYEWDEDVDNGFRPAGEFDLSSTTVSGLQTFTDYGSKLAEDTTATHHLTLYKAPSGALVFGAGTVQWSWGLANVNAWESPTTEPANKPPDPNMEQFTVNLLAEMGAQPGSLSTGLVAGSKSTVTTPPTSTIASPEQGATFADGSKVTISGSAVAAAGAVVAGVEVSTDGGSSWHPATLTTPAEQTVKWTYTWVAHGSPTTNIKSRAVDDSANLEQPSAGVTVNVTCPCSIWGTGTTPNTPNAGDPLSIEVGVKFTSETAGTIDGVRFYKSTANTGTHVGSLWSASGTLLAQATFTGETTSGWQQVNFSTPVQIAANTVYVAGYFAPNGHYAAEPYYFYTPTANGLAHVLSSPPLHALGASSATANGLYSYSPTSTFPTSSYEGSNYWVDPVFSPDTPPGQVTGVSATAGPGSATVSWSAPAGGGEPTSYTVTPYIGASAQQPTTLSSSPLQSSVTISELTAGTAYTFKVQASNPNGAGPISAASNAVTPLTPTAPETPTGVVARPASSKALVSWSAPAGNGGSAIAGYTVTPYVGSTAQSAVKVGASSTSTAVTGLTDGTSYTFKVTASNAIGTSASSAASAAVTPQDTIFEFATPTTVDAGDPSSVELGVKFTAESNGQVTGIRFYKAETNTGTHVGSLWSASGTLLAQATFTGETASGWQQVTFSSPVAIAAGTTYVAGYFAPNGHYSATSAGLSSAVSNPPLRALGNGTSADGVYAYSATSTFPTSTFNSNNYYVDVLFAPAPPQAPEAPASVSASAAKGQVQVSWTAAGANGSPVTGYTVTPYIGSVAQTPVSVGVTTSTTLTGLANGTSYTFKVAASNAVGTGAQSPASDSATPQDTIFEFETPTAIDGGDPSAVELGVKFTSSANGLVTGVRFYKAETNTGTHVGSLWSASGTLLASATFSDESASGWQQVMFSSPVAIAAGTTYVAGYFAPNGHYSVTPAAFSAMGVQNAPLQALSNGTSVDGVYAYSASSTFPTSSFNATNYYVDVLFTPTPVPGQVTGVSATAGPGAASVSWTAPASGGAVTEYTITPYIGSTAQQTTTVSGSPPATGVTVAGLTPGTAYTFKVQASNPEGTGAQSAASNAVTPTALTAPGAPVGVSATAATDQAQVSFSAPSENGGSAITGYTVTPYVGAAAQTPVTVGASATSATIGGLANGTSYTFKVAASNAVGTGGASAATNAVTPQDTIFDYATPATIDSGDGSSIELGVTFTAAESGEVTGIRFYKAPTNTGTHIGSLWGAGTLLASAVFTGETASGWQQVTFSSPVAITAGTTYVAGYFAPNGHYSVTPSAFSSGGIFNGPLEALPYSDGLYAYSSSSTLPGNSYNATNYWVDVLFAPEA